MAEKTKAEVVAELRAQAQSNSETLATRQEAELAAVTEKAAINSGDM